MAFVHPGGAGISSTAVTPSPFKCAIAASCASPLRFRVTLGNVGMGLGEALDVQLVNNRILPENWGREITSARFVRVATPLGANGALSSVSR